MVQLVGSGRARPEVCLQERHLRRERRAGQDPHQHLWDRAAGRGQGALQRWRQRQVRLPHHVHRIPGRLPLPQRHHWRLRDAPGGDRGQRAEALQAHHPPRDWPHHGLDRLRQAQHGWHPRLRRDGRPLLCVAARRQEAASPRPCRAHRAGLRGRLELLQAVSGRQDLGRLQGLDGLDGGARRLRRAAAPLPPAAAAPRPALPRLPPPLAVPAVGAGGAAGAGEGRGALPARGLLARPVLRRGGARLAAPPRPEEAADGGQRVRPRRPLAAGGRSRGPAVLVCVRRVRARVCARPPRRMGAGGLA
mmetsp:Transcript_109901/g.342599  ORF Transcript_109901/g.342599 Transcript_109901/m.342599 type:complete len:305 (-) Transcript_109901:26-940(-)